MLQGRVDLPGLLEIIGECILIPVIVRLKEPGPLEPGERRPVIAPEIGKKAPLEAGPRRRLARGISGEHGRLPELAEPPTPPFAQGVPGTEGLGEIEGPIAEEEGATGGLRFVPIVRPDGDDPEEQQLVDLLEQARTPHPVEPAQAVAVRPARVTQDPEGHQGGLQLARRGRGIAAEAEQVKAQTVRLLAEPIGLGADRIDRQGFLAQAQRGSPQIAQPGPALRLLGGGLELDCSPGAVSALEPFPAEGEQMTDLRVSADAIGLRVQPGGCESDRDRDDGEGDRDPQPVATGPTGHPAGHRLPSEPQRSGVGHGLQVGRELRGRVVTVVGIGSQATPQHGPEGRGDRSAALVDLGRARSPALQISGPGFLGPYRLVGLGDRCGPDGLQEDQTQGVEIRAVVDQTGLALDQCLQVLGGHVGECAPDPLGPCGQFRRVVGQVEVQEHR